MTAKIKTAKRYLRPSSVTAKIKTAIHGGLFIKSWLFAGLLNPADKALIHSRCTRMSDFSSSIPVIPAKAGIHFDLAVRVQKAQWIPARAERGPS